MTASPGFRMPDLAELLAPDQLAARATQSNLRLGQQIVSEGGVAIVHRDASQIEARVGGVASADTRRTVVLAIDAGRLTWSCTCTKQPSLFCKHCVAAALAAG